MLVSGKSTVLVLVMAFISATMFIGGVCVCACMHERACAHGVCVCVWGGVLHGLVTIWTIFSRQLVEIE